MAPLDSGSLFTALGPSQSSKKSIGRAASSLDVHLTPTTASWLNGVEGFFWTARFCRTVAVI
jgi:hypothetical protein